MRFLEAAVAVATALSIGMLGLLLAAPLLPQPSSRVAASSPTAAPSVTPSVILPPTGLYLLRGAFDFGPCLAIQLGPSSFPVGEGAQEGVATVLSWERGMTGCDARSTEVAKTDASVTEILTEAGPDGPVGYTLAFRLRPARQGLIEITILPTKESSPALLQALELSMSGAPGLVFDRVHEVSPTFNPLPSATPAPDFSTEGPMGLFLPQGPLVENVCIALNLAQYSYPPDLGTPGTAFVLWWEHAGSNRRDPGVCLSRTGEMHEADASVRPSWDGVPTGSPDSHSVRFSIPLADAATDFSIAIIAGGSNQDRLSAVLMTATGIEDLVFDRVDELDPPLVTPSPSAGD